MSKLPSIFHSNSKVMSNNKNSFNSFDREEEVNDRDTSFDKDLLINYFNKSVVVELRNGNKSSGILVSKRNDKILLNTGEYIDIKDIVSVK